MKRALALLAPAVLVCGLVACGGDDDDDDSPDTTTATEESATTDTVTDTVSDATVSDDTSDGTTDGTTATGASTETLGQIFPNLSPDQLDCLVDQVGTVDPTQIASQAQQIAEECDIDEADLTPDMSAISIPDLSGVSVPENMDEIIKQVFPGLSDEQANCLAEQFGADFDASKAAQVAETCDIDPADLAPG